MSGWNQAAPLNAQIENDQWQLRELKNTLSRLETLLEENRLAILNGISLYQSGETSQADRLTAYNRVLEAEGELRQIITSICQNNSAYPATVNDCGSRLHPNYDAYASSLAQAAGNLAASENAAGANFTVSVVSTYQICIRVCDPDGNPVNGAAVTVTNQLNNSRKQAATDPKGNAVFWVGDLGAGELAKPE